MDAFWSGVAAGGGVGAALAALVGFVAVMFLKEWLTSAVREAETKRVADYNSLIARELALPAEVRRQVAAHKVAALLEIWKSGTELIRRATARASDVEMVQGTNELLVIVRDAAYLFPPSTADKLGGLVSKALSVHVDTGSVSGLEKGIKNATAAYQELLDVVRHELGTISAPLIEPSAPTPTKRRWRFWASS